MSRSDSYDSLPPLPDFKGIDYDKLNRPSAKYTSGPDFIPYDKRGRDLYGRLCYNTGVLWVSGFMGGGMYGFVEGWRNAASSNTKVRFNSVMNAVSKRGSYYGSNLGVIAFVHTASIGVSDALQLERYANTPVVNISVCLYTIQSLCHGIYWICMYRLIRLRQFLPDLSQVLCIHQPEDPELQH